MSVVSKLSKFIKTSPKSNVRVEINIHKLLELLSGPSHIEKIDQIRKKRSKGNIAKNLAKLLKGKDKLDGDDVYIIQDLEGLLKDISKNKLSRIFIAEDLAKILTIDDKLIEHKALVKLLKDKNYRKSIADLLKINNKYITTKEGLREFVLENIKQNPKRIEDLLNNTDATKLLFNKIDINSTDSKGHTLLYHAVKCENLEIVKLFIKEGTKLNCVDLNGCTPLNLAIKSHNVDITNLLLDAGCDLKYTYNDSKGNITMVYTEDDYKFFLSLFEKRNDQLEKHEQNNHLNTTLHEPTTDQPAVLTEYISSV